MMLRLLPRNGSDEKYATTDRVILSDGQVVEVPRANLAAAKALLAAENAALGRVAREVTARQEPRLPEYAEPLLTGSAR